MRKPYPPKPLKEIIILLPIIAASSLTVELQASHLFVLSSVFGETPAHTRPRQPFPPYSPTHQINLHRMKACRHLLDNFSHTKRRRGCTFPLQAERRKSCAVTGVLHIGR